MIVLELYCLFNQYPDDLPMCFSVSYLQTMVRKSDFP